MKQGVVLVGDTDRFKDFRICGDIRGGFHSICINLLFLHFNSIIMSRGSKAMDFLRHRF